MSQNLEASPVIKAFRLLSHLAHSDRPTALAELSRALKLPKPTVHRLASMLGEIAVVHKDPVSAHYSLGPGFEDIALGALHNGVGALPRRALMDQLSARLGVRTNFTVLRAGKVTYVQWVESTSVLRVDLKEDTQVPVHCSASGKLLMAHAPVDVQARFLKSAPFAPRTKKTITTAKALMRELQAIRRRGYSLDNQEFLQGVVCLAVPVRDRVGNVVAGLAVMAPEASFPLAKAKRHLPEIQHCAEMISSQLGTRPDVRTRRAQGASSGSAAER